MSLNGYAGDFKIAFENQDLENIVGIISAWSEEEPHDANFALAMVILGTIQGEIPSDELFELYLNALSIEPDDAQLFEWYNDVAIQLMEKKVDDEIGFSQMFNNEYKSETVGNDYAQDFLNLFENILENDNFQETKLKELSDIVDEWEKNSPDDANMHCAYVILNINGSQKDLDSRIISAKDGMPDDKNAYAKLLSLMSGLISVKKEIA